MVFTCDFCNKIISECCTLYFGFDCMCCSNHCRSQVIQLNLQIDPKMNSPHTWLIHKLRAEKNKANTKTKLLPKPKSLTDLLTQLQM
jgi:hypothetical protein